MQNILTLPLCQGSYSESKNHEKINDLKNHGTIKLRSHELLESAMPSLEEISVAKAKDTTGADSVSDDATLWTLQGVSDLSKRTALYAFYTAASNGTAAALGYNTPAVDKNSNQFQLGVRHRF